MTGERLRIVGRVQGVGFRPTVARLAREQDLRGYVRNDGAGVDVLLQGSPAQIDAFVTRLREALPALAPLAAIDSLTRHPSDEPQRERFEIVHSEGGTPRTTIVPDAATCAACLEETFRPLERRFRYPFTTCTHCGPRFSIVRALPYDRGNTTMEGFAMCTACQAEYDDPEDRRYHAQPLACHLCGPKVELLRTDGRAFTHEAYSMLDTIDAVGSLLQRGEIVAIEGLGGFHLCCDATHAEAVARLRARKMRPDKPLAMMARDLDVIRRYAVVSDEEEALLTSPAAPIVLLEAGPAPAEHPLAETVAPGQRTVGMMLPTTGLHHLILRRLTRPIVCTSGNVSEEPPCTDPHEALERLGGIADWILRHDRPIAHRVDDSVVRMMAGRPRVLRRARGYAPDLLPAPPGLEHAPPVLATGAHLKSTFALGMGPHILLSQYIGDLGDVRTFEAWQAELDACTRLYDHHPAVVAVDGHPDYRSTVVGTRIADARGLPRVDVRHHHAHIAACLAENGRPLDAPAVLGVALDGLGMGEDGSLWGGEFLLADYRGHRRYGTFKPVPLLGGDQAARQPWRNLYAHLRQHMSWAELEENFAPCAAMDLLRDKPRALLDSMLRTGLRSPAASSVGRLFDAAAAALNLHPETVSFEGQAAMALEALVTPAALNEAIHGDHYPMAIPLLDGVGLPYVEPLGLWRALMADLWAGTDPALIAARFHVALADGITMMVQRAHRAEVFEGTVALSGGVFLNRVLLERVVARLEDLGFEVLTHARVPPGDACIALGQAVIAAASSLPP